MLSVEMVSTSYIQLWHGEIGPLVQHWNSLGHLMESMLLEKAHQKLRFSAKTSRFVLVWSFRRSSFLKGIFLYIKNCVSTETLFSLVEICYKQLIYCSWRAGFYTMNGRRF